MTNDRIDATLRAIVDGSGAQTVGPPPLTPAVLTRARAARAQDRTWPGRQIRDARLVASPDAIRNALRSRPQLAIAAMLVMGAALVGAIAAGSRPTTPAPEQPSLIAVVPSMSVTTAQPSDTPSSAPTPTASASSPSGLLVFSSNGRLVVVRGDGSDRRDLSDGSVADYFPVWSPDGSQIAFFSQDCSPSEACPEKLTASDLVVTGADGSNRRVLRSGLEYAGTPRWIPDGSALVVESGPTGPIEIGLDGGVRRVEPVAVDPPYISPDGSQVLELRGDTEIRVRDTGTGTSVALVAAADPTRSRLSIIGWTPDGDSVAYYVVGRGLPHPVTAWIVARDGSNPRPWSVVPAQGRFFGWSADRAWMLIELPPSTADNTMRYLVARGDGTAPREIDSVGVLEWSRDRTVLLGTAGALTDLYHIGGLVIVIDPSGSLPPVKIETPGLLGMDWRSAG